MVKKPVIKDPNNVIDDIELSQIDEKQVDIYQGTDMKYPVMERLNNGITWPEAPKGRLDLMDTYEISTVPENPNTPLESIEVLEKKKVIPKTKKEG